MLFSKVTYRSVFISYGSNNQAMASMSFGTLSAKEVFPVQNKTSTINFL